MTQLYAKPALSSPIATRALLHAVSLSSEACLTLDFFCNNASKPACTCWCRKVDIEAQIERAQKYARVDEGPADVPQGGELQRDEADGQPLKIALTTAAPDRAQGKPPIAPKLSSAFSSDAR